MNEKSVSFKVVQMVGGRMVVTSPTDIYAWAESIGRSTYHITNFRLRPELQLQPRIQGFVGPMWDGEQNGRPVVRYEDQSSNDVCSL